MFLLGARGVAAALLLAAAAQGDLVHPNSANPAIPSWTVALDRARANRKQQLPSSKSHAAKPVAMGLKGKTEDASVTRMKAKEAEAYRTTATIAVAEAKAAEEKKADYEKDAAKASQQAANMAVDEQQAAKAKAKAEQKVADEKKAAMAEGRADEKNGAQAKKAAEEKKAADAKAAAEQKAAGEKKAPCTATTTTIAPPAKTVQFHCAGVDCTTTTTIAPPAKAVQFHFASKSAASLRGAAPGAAPAAASQPAAPETQADKARKAKGEMYKALGDGHDSDYVVDRPTVAVTGKEAAAPGDWGDIANDDGTAGVPPAPKGPGMPGKTIASDLPSHATHVDKVTATDDFRVEYGRHGPKGAHSPFQPHPFVGYH